MTLANKLRFLADRADDGKEFVFVYNNGRRVIDILNAKCVDDRLKFQHKIDKKWVETSLTINELDFCTLELKPKWEFTDDEKAILRNVRKIFDYIAREENGKLYLYDSPRPSKTRTGWDSNRAYASFVAFDHLFQTIKWEDDEPCPFREYI